MRFKKRKNIVMPGTSGIKTKTNKTTPFSKMKMTIQDTLDIEITRDMSKCLLNLTSSGNLFLDDLELKKFKKICRKSDEYVRFSFMLIMEQMEKKHSEIRLSAFQVAAEIFNRSHAFREILVTHLQDFLTLTTGTETNHPLPPPKTAANKLKELSLKTMQHWHDSYGKSYRKLDVGYNYLKSCKNVDFENIVAQNEAERLRAEQAEQKKQKQIAGRRDKALEEIAESKSEIEDCIREAENCLSLLLPKPDDFLLFTSEDTQQASIPDLLTEKSNSNSNSLQPNSKLLKADLTCDDSIGFEKIKHTDERKDLEESDCLKAQTITTSLYAENCDKPLTNLDDVSAFTSVEKEGSYEFGDADLSLSENDNIKNKVKEVLGNQIEETQDYDEDAMDDDDEDAMDDDDEEDDNELDYLSRTHGFTKPGYSINIEMPVESISVKKTEDNADVLQSLKDAAKLINSRFLPQVIKWLEVLSKNGAKQDDIKSMICLKQNLETLQTKCTELKLVTEKKAQEENDSDDDDLEDVPEKEGYEATVASHFEPSNVTSNQSKGNSVSSLKRHHSATSSTSELDCNIGSMEKAKSFNSHWNLKDREKSEDLADPTSRAAALARIKLLSEESASNTCQPSTSKPESSKVIPYVEFGKDLAHWENPDNIQAPEIIKFDSLHRFWNSGEKESEKASQHDVALMLNRTFSYTGQFQPVKWSCRAPLANGKLCPRMDRVKCPFHGPVIPRDQDGKPAVKIEQNLSSEKADELSTTECDKDSVLQPWLDPELQREIEQATGHNLGSARSQKLLDKALNKGKGKGKSRKKSGLTDIKAATNTSRTRLEKRVFNKRSIRRVCTNLDSADFKRVRDKFANQFNYSLK